MTYLGGLRSLSFALTRSIHNEAIATFGTTILGVSASCPCSEVRGRGRAPLIKCPLLVMEREHVYSPDIHTFKLASLLGDVVQGVRFRFDFHAQHVSPTSELF